MSVVSRQSPPTFSLPCRRRRASAILSTSTAVWGHAPRFRLASHFTSRHTAPTSPRVPNKQKQSDARQSYTTTDRTHRASPRLHQSAVARPHDTQNKQSQNRNRVARAPLQQTANGRRQQLICPIYAFQRNHRQPVTRHVGPNLPTQTNTSGLAQQQQQSARTTARHLHPSIDR